MSYSNRDGGSSASLGVKVGAGLLAIIGFITLISCWGAFESGDTGHIGVIRNGGPFDDKNFRGLLAPSAGPTWIGFHSTVRDYPSTERYDNIVPGAEGGDPTAGDSLQADAYRTSTKDGVSIGIKGQFHYDVNQDETTLAKFDNDYGQRTYPVPGTDDRKEVSDGDDGFAAFIAGQVRPLEEETLRQVIANYDCVNYDPRCIYLKSASSANTDPDAIAKQLQAAPANNQVYQDVANSVVGLMQAKLRGTEFNGQKYPQALGGEYLTNVRFSFTGVDLGTNSDATIQRVQQAGAGAAEARANAAKDTAAALGRANVALADASANENRQRGYVNCPVCAQKELIAAQGEAMGHLPQNLQTYIPGQGQGLSLILPGK
jgi:hypothetical protein